MDAGYRWGRYAAAAALEFAVPLSALGAAPGDLVTFAVRVARRVDGVLVELERHPSGHAIELRVPDSAFEAQHWRA